MPARIKTGDEVMVVGGKDRGKKGTVLRVDLRKDRVYVEGLNMIKRHQRATQTGPTSQQTAGVIEREGGIHVSNVMLLDPRDGRPTRVGIETVEGKRYRIARRSGARLD
jgi:large subunit ribosomal protein L24